MKTTTKPNVDIVLFDMKDLLNLASKYQLPTFEYEVLNTPTKSSWTFIMLDGKVLGVCRSANV